MVGLRNLCRPDFEPKKSWESQDMSWHRLAGDFGDFAGDWTMILAEEISWDLAGDWNMILWFWLRMEILSSGEFWRTLDKMRKNEFWPPNRDLVIRHHFFWQTDLNGCFSPWFYCTSRGIDQSAKVLLVLWTFSKIGNSFKEENKIGRHETELLLRILGHVLMSFSHEDLG
jgi:hypothetical protein